MVSDSAPIVVVGAGVSGLTTALCLVELGVPVQIWADRLPRQTTSAVAGAMWGPTFQEPLDKATAWTEQSFHEFTALAADPASGVHLATVTTVGQFPPGGGVPPITDLVRDLRQCTAGELPGRFSAGYIGTLPLIDMPRYLDFLTRRLADSGVEIERRSVTSLAEVAAVATTFVNCSGVDARNLTADPTVRPVFGQHVVHSNPGIEGSLFELNSSGEWTSYFAHPDRVVCGGTAQPDRWDLTPDPDLSHRIVQRCRELEPRLRDADVLETITGLRPDRPSIRVEREIVGSSRCVHNYGHGGNGVSLSWGCAREAAALATAG